MAVVFWRVVKWIMGTRLAGDEAGLIYYWPLNEGVGNQVFARTAAPS
jgi:hypothetical protein